MVVLCNEKESRSRDSPPAACRFSDVIPYAAVRSPGGFCCIENAVSYAIKKARQKILKNVFSAKASMFFTFCFQYPCVQKSRLEYDFFDIL